MSPWMPPAPAERPDGFECLIWHRGRWRHVMWIATYQGWMFGYASAHTMDAPDRLYAPLPEHTPADAVFMEGQNS